ncbi:aldo-keto reductase AKR2E4-like [Pieris brassicae]|uniref:NADP-dependent oxidoreductase domain-containing protein n=1 Tax=Pieris brassicae TaxID=7116 RepID=A0A9P0TGR7_PIEBR|nr:aldo-keto reductase AKR2E4-like [Pieris brassicae]CAH4031958.1 unnamed protein product [Pieris brassicae]
MLLILCFILYAHGAVIPKYKINDGFSIPAIALGTWLGNNTKPSADDVEQAVTWAIESGYTHVDTAWIYNVEQQVGRALKKFKREDVFITTKLWNDKHARSSVIPALRQSLDNLQTTYVDLYLIHWPVGQFQNGSYDSTDYLETWRGLIDAKNAGLTRSIGVSNFNQQMIDRILENGLEKPVALQVELNLNLQQPALLSYCKEKNITVMAYTPFGSIFPWKAKETSPPPRVDDPAMIAMATRYNKTVPQVVLRYLVELGVVPLPKSLTKSRIEQNIDIFDFSLSEEDKQLLKSYDKNYRTIPQYKWRDHPFYPFERTHTE